MSNAGCVSVTMTHVEGLLRHHQHPVLGILPHVLVDVEGRDRHVDAPGEKLHL